MRGRSRSPGSRLRYCPRSGAGQVPTDRRPGRLFQKSSGEFSDADAAARILEKYFIEGGKKAEESFKSIPVFTIDPTEELVELTVIANFCEVFLPRKGTPALLVLITLKRFSFPTSTLFTGPCLRVWITYLWGQGCQERSPVS